MSKYTTEVRFICENKSGLDTSSGSNDVDTIIANSWDKIFTTKVSFFDEEYRSVLCQKILKHYYLREIGAETVGVWTLWMNTRLEEIMPYYNQLYKSELIKFDPMHDVDLTRSHKLNVEGSKEENGTRNDVSKGSSTSNEDEEVNTTNDGKNSLTGTRETDVTGNDTSETKGSKTTDVTGKSTTNTTGKSDDTNTDLYSDTPQGAITGLENENYLTNARKITDSNNSSGSEITDTTSKTEGNYTENNTANSTENTNTKYSENGTSNNTGKETTTRKGTGSTNGSLDSTTSNSGTSNTTEDYIETIIGKQNGMTFSKMLIEFRETFLNIDMQVINEFSDLFFGLW